MKLLIVARGYYLLRVFFSLIAGIFLTIFFFDLFDLDLRGNIFIFLFFFIYCALFFVLYRITNTIDKAEVELKIVKEGLKITWIRQFYFFKKEDRIVRWDDIQQYLFQPDQHFDMFIIKFRSKKKMKFNLKETSEEFLHLFSQFEEKIKEMKPADPTISITKAKNMYEKKSALVFAYILGFMIIGMVGFLIFGETKNSPNYGNLLIFFGGSLFYKYQVYIHRKKAKIG